MLRNLFVNLFENLFRVNRTHYSSSSDLGYKNEIVLKRNTITRQIFDTEVNFSK